MPDRRFRLAILASHPIQYQAPLWRSLAQHPALALQVLFFNRFGLETAFDPGFGREVSWDIPLLDGYPHEFLLNYSPWRRSNTFWTACNPSLAARLSSQLYDAVLVHGWNLLSNWLAFSIAHFRRLPVLLRGDSNLSSLHRGRVRLKQIVLPRLFRSVAAFLAVGTENRAFYQRLGVPPERIFSMPFAVDNDFFAQHAQSLRPQRRQLRARWGIPERAVVALFVGKLTRGKRPQDLLEAVHRLARLELAAVLVGDGELRPVLERQTHALGLRNIFFLGFQNQSRLPELYAAADLLVLPSEQEGWGLVINEAMNFGLPILASSAVGAAVDLVKNGENGLVFPPGNIPALAHALEQTVRDATLRARFGQRSAEIIQHWSFRQDAEGLLAALRALRPSA